MKRIIPSAGTPIGLDDIAKAIISRGETFSEIIKAYGRRRYVLLTNSGTTAFYLILNALKKLSDKREVILPAYTAPSLVLPIRRAGLIPRLCDISLKTFNMDISRLHDIIGDNTLVVSTIHMFGIPLDLERSMGADFLVEDFASALGTTVRGRPVGSLGDVSFVSFNRGKNLSTVAGGAILTDREDIYTRLRQEEKVHLAQPGFRLRMEIVLKSIALSLAVRPRFYSLFKAIISQYKHMEVHDDFLSYGYTRFQAGLGASLFQNARNIFEIRHKNGMYLHSRLSGTKGITLPEIPSDSIPAFNQFPMLVDEASRRDAVYNALVEEGIEATTLYPEPIHRVYDDLGCDLSDDPFPAATHLSRRLLLIPTHPYVSRDALARAVDIIMRSLCPVYS